VVVAARISLSPTIRASLNDDGSLDLMGVGVVLHLDLDAVARLSALLGDPAANEAQRLRAALERIRDEARDPASRLYARGVLREEPDASSP
jgi:hypothetical protein